MERQPNWNGSFSKSKCNNKNSNMKMEKMKQHVNWLINLERKGILYKLETVQVTFSETYLDYSI